MIVPLVRCWNEVLLKINQICIKETKIYVSSNQYFLIYLIYFLFKDNCFTEFCYLLSNLNMNQHESPLLLKLRPISLPILPL